MAAGAVGHALGLFPACAQLHPEASADVGVPEHLNCAPHVVCERGVDGDAGGLYRRFNAIAKREPPCAIGGADE